MSLPERFRDYVTLLDGEIDFRMTKEQLKNITYLHNNGIHYEDIARKEKIKPIVVIIALLHQAYLSRVHLAPLAFRFVPRQKNKKGNKFHAVAKIEQTRKGVPNIIEIEGRRYVHEPE